MAKRRGHNEGSVFQRKTADRLWVASFRDHMGKRRTLYARTRAEAAAKLVDALKHVKDGVYTPSDGRTVEMLAGQWIAAVQQLRREKTLSSYRWALRHILPALGKMKLHEVRPGHIQELYSECAAKGLAPKSVRNVHLALHAMFEKAFQWGLVMQNPAARVDAPRVERKDPPMLTSAQVRGLLDAAKGHPYEALVALAVTSGARSGELLGMTWDRLDLEAGTMDIRVALSWSKAKREFQLVEPKTKSSKRTVALTTLAVEALRRHRIRQLEQRMKLGTAWQDKWSLVFTNNVGAPVDHNNFLRRDFRPMLKKAGLPAELTFHDMRHVAASLALSNGLPITLLAEQLGHADASTTLRVYSHAIPLSQHLFAKAMDAAIAG